MPANRNEQSLVLDKEVLVPAPVQDVFEAWTTSAGTRRFFAPDARIEAVPGGAYEILFMTEAPEGKRGSEGCRVLEAKAPEHLAFTWNFPPSIPTIRNEHTRVDVWFEKLSESSTRVRMKQSEWKTGGDWDKGFRYFDQAWDLVLGRLKRSFEGAPMDWASPGS